jgi:spore coat polysaccharide biosynthesis protein SpsF (cytidylyltransferase family)
MAPEEREHITPALKAGPWPRTRVRHVSHRDLEALPYFNVSVDTPSDLARVRMIYETNEDRPPTLDDLIYLRLVYPEMFE